MERVKGLRRSSRGLQLTVEVGVDGVLENCPRAKVNEFELPRAQVHQQVLVLDVPVHDAAAVAVAHRLQHLAEKAAGRVLVQGALFRDEVEQVLDELWPLHDDEPAVDALVIVQQFNNSPERRTDLLEQQDL